MSLKVRKRGKYYWYRFMVKGREYHGSTNLTKERDALTKAGEIRKQIILGNVGILKAGPAPKLREFLEKDFLPFVRVNHKEKPKTLEYYVFGAKQLIDSQLSKLEIDQISSAETAKYREEYSHFSPSGINQGLRTLRRALRLAFQWKKISALPTISLVGGEKQRKLVVSEEFEAMYLECAKPLWRTMIVIAVELGLRPGEIFALKVDDIDWDVPSLMVQSGKSKAAKRELPLTDNAYLAIKAWWKSIGSPPHGYLFPSPDIKRKGRPYHQQRAYEWHAATLVKMKKKAEKNGDKEIISFLKRVEEEEAEKIVPYTFRHTALTRLAEHTPNPYAVAAAAGHSTISMTYRYVHPQRAEIWKAFESKSSTKIGNAKRREKLKVVGSEEEVNQ